VRLRKVSQSANKQPKAECGVRANGGRCERRKETRRHTTVESERLVEEGGNLPVSLVSACGRPRGSVVWWRTQTLKRVSRTRLARTGYELGERCRGDLMKGELDVRNHHLSEAEGMRRCGRGCKGEFEEGAAGRLTVVCMPFR
jgi:hypothetical protein